MSSRNVMAMGPCGCPWRGVKRLPAEPDRKGAALSTVVHLDKWLGPIGRHSQPLPNLLREARCDRFRDVAKTEKGQDGNHERDPGNELGLSA